jgi:acyl-CoA reductase-like NAD-dependent aldehyde dehydrogenase
MGLKLKAGTDWNTVFQKARSIAPEAFDEQSIRNLINGEWVVLGKSTQHKNPVDQSLIVGPSMLSLAQAEKAVEQAAKQDAQWSKVPLDERKVRVSKAVELLKEHRDTIALLLVWEIGKPWKIACADVDRCVEGVEWYLGEIDRQMTGRTP